MNRPVRATALATLVLGLACTQDEAPGDDAMRSADEAALLSVPLDAEPDSAAEADRQRWSGTVYPPVPDRVEKLAGAVALAPEQTAADSRWAFAHVRVEAGGMTRDMLWLSRLVSRGADGKPTWQVVDVEPLPDPSPNERVLISACRSDGRTAVAAVVPDARETWLTGARAAWGVDRREGTLVPLAEEPVRCRRPMS